MWFNHGDVNGLDFWNNSDAIPADRKDKMGTIEDISLRITRMRTANGELVIVPNGGIVRVINFSRDWARAVVDIPLPATADATMASRVRALIATSLS